ncbi:MAG: hypothetical protein ACRDRV_02915 [Pseudonocardiaceae bacterium]
MLIRRKRDGPGAFEPDAVMSRIAQGIELGQRGDRSAARAMLREIGDEIGQDGEALYRCSVAHSMADVQDDLERGAGLGPSRSGGGRRRGR